MGLDKNIIARMQDEGSKGIKEMLKGMHTLENHMVVVTQNQVEFEKYLKDILEKLDELGNK